VGNIPLHLLSVGVLTKVRGMGARGIESCRAFASSPMRISEVVMDTARDMTSRELIRWSLLHERRGRTLSPLAFAVIAGAALAAWVRWRSSAGVAAASHAWLAGAIVAYVVAFLRVPFHLYWRADAALLAQLPIEGRPLLDAAMLRCLRAALYTTGIAVIGAIPLAFADATGQLVMRHAAFAATLGVAAGLLLPAVTMGAAALVVQGGEQLLRTATALGGAPTRARAASSDEPRPRTSSPAALLGLFPGLAASAVLVVAILVRPWLVGAASDVPAPVGLGAIAVTSVIAAVAARSRAAIMSRILRDVSALDRQRLATLEIKPPTSLERLIGKLIGDARLLYEKDARLMRRRFPMAYALGGIVFAVLVIVGIARPDDPTAWLTVAIGGAASYGIVLANRLHRSPIELVRLSATLPLAAPARARAKLAWLLGWWSVFVLAPAVFAALRQTDRTMGLALAAAATIAIVVAGAWRR
jgi:hypothetical protein